MWSSSHTWALDQVHPHVTAKVPHIRSNTLDEVRELDVERRAWCRLR